MSSTRTGACKGKTRIPEDVEAIVQSVIHGALLHGGRLRIQDLHDFVCHRITVENWGRATGTLMRYPSRSTIARRLKDKAAARRRDILRQGRRRGPKRPTSPRLDQSRYDRQARAAAALFDRE